MDNEPADRQFESFDLYSHSIMTAQEAIDRCSSVNDDLIEEELHLAFDNFINLNSVQKEYAYLYILTQYVEVLKHLQES